jgi:hypothetical protein
VNSHALPFYNSIPNSVDKAFMEFNNDDHFCVMNGNSHYDTLGRYMISWIEGISRCGYALRRIPLRAAPAG